MNLSIVIVNRNRSFEIVTKTLNSIVLQLHNEVVLTVVDYGSEIAYQQELEKLLQEDYSQINFILCPTQGQLFHKTRAINMVLRDCTTSYFMVLDMDCIVHPQFIDKALELASLNTVYNFPYGFLKEEESKISKEFNDYKVDFIGGLTGTAIFNTKKLQSINGFDEFYHSWGAEDADMFDRLERIGVSTILYQEELLLLHQWHSKGYRDTKSRQPFHSSLEKVNHEYYTLSRKRNTTKVNFENKWGLLCDTNAYVTLNESLDTWCFQSYNQEIKGLLASLVEHPLDYPVTIKISKVSKSIKDDIKGLMKKKIKQTLNMEEVNDNLLEVIIMNYRNTAYSYQYDRQLGVIQLSIHGEIKV